MPSTRPARYTARNPLPWASVATPKASSAERQREHRVEPAARRAGAGESRYRPPYPTPAPDRGADHQLHHDLDQDPPAGCRARAQQVLGEHGGEDDRDRVVDAGLDLERDAHPPLELEPAAPEHGEHRRRIGGGHHRAEHQRLGPAEAPR